MCEVPALLLRPSGGNQVTWNQWAGDQFRRKSGGTGFVVPAPDSSDFYHLLCLLLDVLFVKNLIRNHLGSHASAWWECPSSTVGQLRLTRLKKTTLWSFILRSVPQPGRMDLSCFRAPSFPADPVNSGSSSSGSAAVVPGGLTDPSFTMAQDKR